MIKNNTYIRLLSPLDIITVLYVVASALYLFLGISQLQGSILPHILYRMMVLFTIFILLYLKSNYDSAFVSFLKNLYPLIFIGYFYTETSYLKNIIISTNLDAQVSALELYLWNCQPSIEFAQKMPQAWFSELMSLCYFSYYLITTGVCLAIYFKNKIASYQSIFVVICSFYLYYTVFALIPVAGPQFFYGVTETEPPYLFGKIMHYILIHAEEPTGAFPSSHVGVSLILCYLAYKYHKLTFYICLPFTIGICFATVYLKAHYLVDVVAAFISAPLFIWISNKLYKALNHQTPKKTS